MNYLELILTFLGGGVLASFLGYLISKKQENREDKKAEAANYQLFVSDIYKEIGRLQQEVLELRKEREELFDELIIQREKNAEIKTQYESLKKDYEELIEINRDLRNKIDDLLKKREV